MQEICCVCSPEVCALAMLIVVKANLLFLMMVLAYFICSHLNVGKKRDL